MKINDKNKQVGRINLKLRPETDEKLRFLAAKTHRKLTSIVEMGIELVWEKENGKK